MDDGWRIGLREALLGRSGAIARREWDWALTLDGGAVVSLPVPWRIVERGRIAFADRDDGQMFGLPAPVDGVALVNGILAGRAIVAVDVDPETADLALTFSGGARLEAFNNSAGYEGWQILLPPEAGGLCVIARGGGEVSAFG